MFKGNKEESGLRAGVRKSTWEFIFGLLGARLYFLSNIGARTHMQEKKRKKKSSELTANPVSQKGDDSHKKNES